MSHQHTTESILDAPLRLACSSTPALSSAEVVFGLLSHSLTLLADAGHNLRDVMGCSSPGARAISTAAVRPNALPTACAAPPSSPRSSMPFFFLSSVGAIAAEAIRRLREPAPVAGLTMIWVAAAGVVINGRHRLDVHRRSERRSQYSRRFPSYGGGRGRLRRRGRGGLHHS